MGSCIALSLYFIALSGWCFYKGQPWQANMTLAHVWCAAAAVIWETTK